MSTFIILFSLIKKINFRKINSGVFSITISLSLFSLKYKIYIYFNIIFFFIFEDLYLLVSFLLFCIYLNFSFAKFGDLKYLYYFYSH